MSAQQKAKKGLHFSNDTFGLSQWAKGKYLSSVDTLHCDQDK